jgi:hypothetical protein
MPWENGRRNYAMSAAGSGADGKWPPRDVRYVFPVKNAQGFEGGSLFVLRK